MSDSSDTGGVFFERIGADSAFDETLSGEGFKGTVSEPGLIAGAANGDGFDTGIVNAAGFVKDCSDVGLTGG